MSDCFFSVGFLRAKLRPSYAYCYVNAVLESGLVFRLLSSNKLVNADGQWKDGVDESYSKKGPKRMTPGLNKASFPYS